MKPIHLTRLYALNPVVIDIQEYRLQPYFISSASDKLREKVRGSVNEQPITGVR